jgi:hypothetical protein
MYRLYSNTYLMYNSILARAVYLGFQSRGARRALKIKTEVFMAPRVCPK